MAIDTKEKKILIGVAMGLTVAIAITITSVVLVSRSKRKKDFADLLDAIDNKALQASVGKGSPFDPSTYDHNTSSTSLNLAEAQKLADTVYLSKSPSSEHWVTDDEAAVVAIFKNELKNIYDVSFLAKTFYQKYGQDMYTYMDSFMTNKPFGHNYLADVNTLIQQM